jgi:Cation transporter/ATPase, N-terminus
LSIFNTEPAGLNASQARERLEQQGPNELTPPKKISPWRHWGLQKRQAGQVGHNLQLRWLSGQLFLAEAMPSTKSGKPEIGGVMPLHSPYQQNYPSS